MLCVSASAYHRVDEEAIINSKAAASKQYIDAFLQVGSVPLLSWDILCHKDTHLPASKWGKKVYPKWRGAANAAICVLWF